MRDIARRLQAGADHVAAGLLAAMFATFIFQVLARYVFLRFYPGLEIGWTVEFSMTLWLWVVLWGRLSASRKLPMSVLTCSIRRQAAARAA
ncbi:hypothetical protein V6L77_24185 [Pannonibacter sp. Pt2-lr]